MNILLNVFWIYGSGPSPGDFCGDKLIAKALHIPVLGVVGAAWATLIGRSAR
ncbi:MAG: hypothetical protein R3A47_08055 [Polyangiales bacterium]